MADSCIPIRFLQAVFNRQRDNSGTSENQPFAPMGARKTVQESLQAAQQLQRRHEELSRNINSLLDSATGARPTDQIDLEDMAIRSGKQLNDLLENFALAGESYAKARQKLVQERMNQAADIRTQTMWQKLAASLTHKLVRNTGIFEGYLLGHFGSEGATSGNNPVVAHARAIQGKNVGLLNSFKYGLIDPFLTKCRPYAERLGMDTIEFAKAVVAPYQLYKHMPERTKHLIDRMDKDIAKLEELYKQHPEDAIRISLENLKSDRGELIAHMDDPHPFIVNEDGHETGQRYLSAGRTLAEARDGITELLTTYRIPEAELAELGAELTAMNNAVMLWRADHKLLSVEEVRALPQEFMDYVPVRTHSDEASSIGTDGAVYIAGNLHQMKGTRDGELQDSFTSIYKFMQRTAQEAATADLFLDLATAAKNDRNPVTGKLTGEKHGLRIYDYDTAVRMANSRDPVMRRIWENKLQGNDGFAMTGTLAEPLADGSAHYRRYLVVFDKTWNDPVTGLTGRELSQSLSRVENGTFTRAMGRATGALASLNTHWNPAFSPINMFRDTGERMNAMAVQSYRTQDGRIIDGSSMVGAYLANIPRVARWMLGHMRGETKFGDSPIGRNFMDYVRIGLKQEFDPTQMRELSEPQLMSAQDAQHALDSTMLASKQGFADKFLNDPRLAPLKQAAQAVGKLGVLKTYVSRWNDFFNNVSAFAQYHTLREHGIIQESAREGVMEIMNLRESGTWTPAFRAVWAFAKPTMQGAANLARCLGLAPNAKGEFKLNRKGWAIFAGELAALTTIASLIRGTMGDDEYDKLSLEDKARFLYLPMGENDGLKVPIPFGPAQVAAMTSAVWDMVSRDKMDVEDGAAHLLSSIARAVHPADFPTFSAKADPAGYLMQLMTPELVKPVMQVATNKNSFGSPITWADRDGLEPLANQGRTQTASGWSTLAKSVRATTGMDMAPEQWRTLVSGYLGGMARVFSDAIEFSSDYHGSFDESTRAQLGPWLSALGFTITYRHLPESHAQQFYEEFNRIKGHIRDLGIEDLTSKSAYKTTEERVAYQSRKMRDAGLPEEEIAKYFAMEALNNKKRTLTADLRKSLEDSAVWDGDDYHERAQELYEAWEEQAEELYRQGLGLL